MRVRLLAWWRRLWSRDMRARAPAAVSVVQPVPPAIAPKLVRPALPRPLAAQLATQARLNVPAGRKPAVGPVTSNGVAKASAMKPKPVARNAVKANPPKRMVWLSTRVAAPVPKPSAQVLPFAGAPARRPAARVRIAA